MAILKMRSRYLFAALLLVLGACSAGTEVAVDDSPPDTTPPDYRIDSSEEESVEVSPATAPTIQAGEISTGSVEIDGVAIDYVISAPVGFEPGDEAPLLLALPPGGQDLALTLSLVTGTYSPEAQRLGWVVVSPAAPNGELFFQGSEALLPGFLDWVELWVTPEGGAPHVAGISNGGISSFRFGAQNPDRVQSLIAFPGFPRSEEDQAALAGLTDVPVRLFVGGNDTGWIGPAENAVESLTSLGGDAELTIFAGEGHVMDSTRDGTVIFELLESFR